MAVHISKECFPPPTECYNCLRKNRKGVTKIKEGAREFKRCSGCHLLSYCDKDCQKEHWDKAHKNHCKFLSGKKVVEGVKHVTDSCSLCIQEKKTNFSDITSSDSPKTNCHVEDVVLFMKISLGQLFDFHAEGKACSCSTRFACELPFQLGEITGTYVGGGGDEMLAHALKILNAMNLKGVSANYRFQEKFKEYFISISLMRISNWGNILIDGSGLQGGGNYLSEMGSLVNDVKSLYGSNDAWLDALSFTSDFIYGLGKNLDYMKCDSRSLEDPRFPLLKRMREFRESQMKLCQQKNAMVKFKLWPSVTGGSLVILLPEDIHCGNCQAPLTGPVFVGLKPVEDETRPALMILSGEQGGPVASCPVAERKCCWVKCAMQHMAFRIQVEGLQEQLDQEYLLFISEIRYCDMCLVASLSSHRCTECLAAQYCSKECQRKDLAFHKTVCSQWAKDKARKLLRGKKQVEFNESELLKERNEAKEAGTK